MLDRDGPIPVYQQVADLIADEIRQGVLKPGQPIPSEAELERLHQIARTTARRVARELRDRGLVHTIQGEGTFVGPPGGPRKARKIPLYETIGADLVGQIRNGELKPHRPIPSEKTMMQRYGIAKATARSVVSYLRERGWVFTVAYRGTYVSMPADWPS